MDAGSDVGSRPPRRRAKGLLTVRQLKRAAGVLLPVTALVVVLMVVRGAGIPLTVPGVVFVFVLLFVGRAVVGWSRRRRRDHPINPRRRPR